MPKRVLIVYSDVAGGHKSSANAIANGIKLADPKTEVKTLDLFKILRRFPFREVEKSWELASKYWIVEKIISLTFLLDDIPFIHSFSNKIIGWRVLKPTYELVQDFKPDIIVSTHLLVTSVIGELKKKYPQFQTVSVAADLIGFPRPYADKSIDLLFTATEEGAKRYERFGVKPENIAYPYFPVNPNLKNYHTKEDVLAELDFNKEKPVILITSGGLGMVRLKPCIDELAVNKDLQLIVLAGKDPKVQTSYAESHGNNGNIKVMGFVKNVQDYLNACDVMVGKPGPATLVETELFQKKAVFTQPVGPQERDNVKYLKKNPNFRFIGNDYSTLVPTLLQLLKDEYVEFSPRFGFDAAVKMAEKTLQL